MSVFSRLDDRNVEDPIIRAYLDNDIIKRSASYDLSLITKTILEDEEFRPDLAAFRVYGESGHQLRWVITLVAGNISEDQALPVGEDLYLPTATWIRDRIRHWSTRAEHE